MQLRVLSVIKSRGQTGLEHTLRTDLNHTCVIKQRCSRRGPHSKNYNQTMTTELNNVDINVNVNVNVRFVGSTVL